MLLCWGGRSLPAGEVAQWQWSNGKTVWICQSRPFRDDLAIMKWQIMVLLLSGLLWIHLFSIVVFVFAHLCLILLHMCTCSQKCLIIVCMCGAYLSRASWFHILLEYGEKSTFWLWQCIQHGLYYSYIWCFEMQSVWCHVNTFYWGAGFVLGKHIWNT